MITFQWGLYPGLAWIMLVKDLMKTRIITVSPEESIEIAAREMVRFGISCLLVKDESRIVGVITERDLLTRVIAIGRDPKWALRQGYHVHPPDICQSIRVNR